MSGRDPGHDTATSAFSSLALRAAGAVLAGPAQKGHSRLNLGGARDIRAPSA